MLAESGKACEAVAFRALNQLRFMRLYGKGVFMDETNTEVVKGPPHSTDIQGGSLETKVIGISGMTCDKCVQTIERALKDKPGVEKVQVNREGATATVTWNRKQTNLPELHEILLKSGYKPTGGVVE